MIDAVEGIHYIFDRYAFLNDILQDGGSTLNPVNKNSSQKEIEEAIKFGRVLHHPDRQAKTGEKNRKEAERVSGIIAECERILTDADMKASYDQRLEWFKEEKPQTISTDGRAKIILGEEYFDVNQLLSEDVTDTKEFEKRAKEMLKYDEAAAPRMKALYESMPGVSEIENLYRQSLVVKFSYLDLLEGAAWAKVGYLNKKRNDSTVVHADDFMAHVDADLKKSATFDIGEAFEGQKEVMKLGMSTVPLLIEFNKAAKDENSVALAIEDLKAHASRNYEIRAEYVREIGLQKQEVLTEFLKIPVPVETLKSADASDKIADFYVASESEENGKILLPFKFRVNTDTLNMNPEAVERDVTIASLKAETLENPTFIVTRTPEIPSFLMEVVAAAEQYGEKMKKANEPKATKTQVPKI